MYTFSFTSDCLIERAYLWIYVRVKIIDDDYEREGPIAVHIEKINAFSLLSLVLLNENDSKHFSSTWLWGLLTILTARNFRMERSTFALMTVTVPIMITLIFHLCKYLKLLECFFTLSIGGRKYWRSSQKYKCFSYQHINEPTRKFFLRWFFT